MAGTMSFPDNPFEKFRGELDRMGLRIGLPSYVWPAGYADNVGRMKDIFGAVQILCYEEPKNTPAEIEEVERLTRLQTNGLAYCLHLPVPSTIGVPGGRGGEEHLKAISLFKPLDISYFVMHVEKSHSGLDPMVAARRIGRLLEATGIEPHRLCIENLRETPFDPVWDAVKPLGVSICADLGHLLADGEDPLSFLDRYENHVRMAHLHGVAGRDHAPLSFIPAPLFAALLQRLAGILPEGIVVIENFTVGDMVSSIQCLSDHTRRLCSPQSA